MARTALALALALGTPFVSAANSSRSAPLRLFDGDSKAKCLDGSPAGYYYRPALGGNETKWVFSLQGGGECVSEDDCKSRAEGDLGSSNGWSTEGEGQMVQFQEDSARNPNFASWNHVFVMYCTGDLHMGMVETPTEDQWGWAQFSGGHVVDAVIADLVDTAGLDDAEIVVWSGDSAGGIGSSGSLDLVADALPNARVVGAPIAGYYWNNSVPYTGTGALDYVPFDSDGFEELSTLWQLRVPDRCSTSKAWSSQPWVCAMLNFSIATVESEIFVIEFEVDSVQLYLHSGVPSYNTATADYVLGFGETMSGALADQVLNRERKGLFSPSCFSHTSFDADGVKLDGHSYLDAFADFLFGTGAIDDFLFDDCCSTGTVVFNPTCP